MITKRVGKYWYLFYNKEDSKTYRGRDRFHLKTSLSWVIYTKLGDILADK